MGSPNYCCDSTYTGHNYRIAKNRRVHFHPLSGEWMKKVLNTLLDLPFHLSQVQSRLCIYIYMYTCITRDCSCYWKLFAPKVSEIYNFAFFRLAKSRYYTSLMTTRRAEGYILINVYLKMHFLYQSMLGKYCISNIVYELYTYAT